MKFSVQCLLAGAVLSWLASVSGQAQVVNDGATNTLANVTNTITGTVTVGTNGSFTLLVLSDNALLTNSAHGVIGRNATAQSNEVQLLSATARWLMGNDLFVGSNGAFHRLVVSNGAFLNNNNGVIGNGAPSSNNFALVTGGGSLWSNRLDLTVGTSGRDNQMIVSNGARVVSRIGNIGQNAGSSNNLVVVTGNGSVWTNHFDLNVGMNERFNRLVIEAGGRAGGGEGRVGAGFMSDGSEALVAGPGSLWSSRTDLAVGLNSGNNRLVVSNGAAVVAGNNGRVGVSGAAGGNQVLVTGAGSTWSNRFELYVGEGTAGNRMEVNGGGLVVSSNTHVGLFGGGTVALVTGAGSTWSNRAGLFVGASGSGNQFVASNGASVFVGDDAVVGLNNTASSNSLVITGPGSALRSTLHTIVGRNGAGNRLRLADGGSVSSVSGFIGHSSANNEGVLTGPGAAWTNQLDFYVGFFGSGNRLTISNGATLHANDSSYLGYNPGSGGNTATITGPGSVWRSANRLIVGDLAGGQRLTANSGAALIVGGDGVIGVTSGASNNNFTVAQPGTALTVAGNFFAGSNGAFNVMQLATGASASIGGRTYVGSGTNGNNNTLDVSGVGSVWTSQGDFWIGGGGPGRNLLLVRNGGVMRGLSSAYLGLGGPLNEVIVADPGSLLELLAGTVFVGVADPGNQMTIRDGGVVRSASGEIGPLTFCSNALVTVTGAGSKWLTGTLTVGSFGPGHRLIINNGGAVEASFGVSVGETPSSTHNRVTVDGGTLRATNATFPVGLNVRRGTNVLNAGLIEMDRLLLTNAQGFFEFNGGTLTTRGAAISNGLPFTVGRGGSTPATWDVRAGGGGHALAGRLIVGGNASFNQVFITNGAILTGGEYTFLALTSGSNNTVTVSGPGSTLNSPSGFFVGADGNANGMLINNGGKASASVGSAGTFIGRSVGTRSNAVTVADPDSRWSVNDTLYVGSGGHGNRLVISNAAAVDSLNGSVGNATSGSNNLALVTGANSSWSNRSDFYVGAGGSGNRLIVTDGGTVIHSNAFLGLNSGSLNNTVEVSGGGSRWSSLTDLTVGYDGSGNQMSVLAGAVASVGRNLLVGRNPVSSSGNRLVVDGGTLAVTNGAGNAVLEIHRGTNVLNAGLIEADILRMTNGTLGKLEFNGGALAIKSSRISVGNPVNIGNGASPATLHLAGNGTHDMTGTLGLIIRDNATLSGNGALLVQLQVRAGATLSPGASIGKISVNTAPFLAGLTVMEISKNGAALTNDQFQVTGTLTYGGTLTVSNLGPTTLAPGDSFPLFSATAYAGAFTALNLPPLPPPLLWKNNLLVNGSLEVAAPPAISLSAGPHMQNFDALATNGGANLWRDNSTLLGWYAGKSVAPTNITSYIASDGSGGAGALYSFGSPGSSERALGSIGSGSVGFISYGLSFTNDTGATVSNFVVSYTGEQWRDSSSFNTNALTFWHRVSAVALTNPEPGTVTGWVAQASLHFASPTVTGAGVGIDGNNPAHRRLFATVPVAGLTVPPGHCVFFRWQDTDDTGTDEGIAVDDLTVAFAVTLPKLTSIVANPTNGFALLSGAGETNLTYGIEAATNLTAPVFWQRLGSNTADGAGLFQFTDTNTPAFPVRFYRLRFP